MKKLAVLALTVIMCATSFVGCQKLDLTEEEEDLIVGYAIDCILKFDYDYVDKLLQVETTTEPKTSKKEETTEDETEVSDTTIDETTGSLDIETDENGEPVTGSKDEIEFVDLDIAMNISGFNFVIKGYEIEQVYKGPDGNGSKMDAGANNNFVLVKVGVKNTTNKQNNLNMLELNHSFKAIINGKSLCDEQIWANDYTLNVYEGDFEVDEEKTLVLAFKVSKSITVDSIWLLINNGDFDSFVAVNR